MRAFLVAVFFVGTILIASPVSPQSRETETSSFAFLEKRLPGGPVEDMATLDAFSMALNYSGVPGGIVRMRTCEEMASNNPSTQKG
jgi:hypothetical protein